MIFVPPGLVVNYRYGCQKENQKKSNQNEEIRS